MEKLLKHQLEYPFPVEKARPEVPPALPAVLGKMLAKAPEERYQSAGEVAAALAPFCESGSYTAGAGSPLAKTTFAPMSGGNAAFRFDTSTDVAPTRAVKIWRRHGNRVAPYVVAAAVAVLLTLIVLVAVLMAAGSRKPPPDTGDVEHSKIRPTDRDESKSEKISVTDRSARIPAAPDELLAASIQDGAALAAVINLQQLAAAPAIDKHVVPALQPVLRALAMRQIDPRKQWDRAVVSVDGDTQSRVLVVLHTLSAVRPVVDFLGQNAPAKTMPVDEHTNFTYLEMADLDKGKPSYLAPLGELALALASDLELLRQVTARFQGKAKEAGNDFLLQQLARTRVEASIRIVMLGRLSLGNETFSAHGIRSFAGELTLSDTAEFAGQARLTDLDAFTAGWWKLKKEMTLAGLFDVRLALLATLVAKATVGAPATEGGYVHVAINGKLTVAETDVALKGIGRRLDAKVSKQAKDKSSHDR